MENEIIKPSLFRFLMQKESANIAKMNE